MIALVCVVLLALVAVAYREAPANGFHFDDRYNILDNPAVHATSLDLETLRRAAAESPLSNRKLANVTLAIDWWRGGGDPRPFQITNVAIHALTTLAVLLLLSLILGSGDGSLTVGRFGAAAIGAGLWAAHPIQVQAVTYIVQRMASLATLFTVLAVSMFLLARRAESKRLRLAYAVLCVLGSLAAVSSKESAWILPVLLLGAELGVARSGGPLFRSRAERIGVSALFWLAIGLFVLSCLGVGPVAEHFESSYDNRDFSMAERLMTQPRVVLFHVSQLLWPDPGRFALEHDFTVSTSLVEPWATLPAVLLVLSWSLLGLYCLGKASRRSLGFLMLWVPAALLIESSFVALEMVFEHRMYLASIGLFGLVAWALGLGPMANGGRGQWLRGAATLLIVLLAGLTSVRVPVWRTDLSLSQQNVAAAPGSDRAWANHGLALLRAGKADEARAAFQTSLDLNPRNGQALEYLGVLLLDDARLDEAEQMLLRASASGRNTPSLMNHTGELYFAREDYEAAERYFSRAIASKPWVPVYHFNLALSVERQGLCSRALQSWLRFLDLERNQEQQQTVTDHLDEVHYSAGGACFVGDARR